MTNLTKKELVESMVGSDLTAAAADRVLNGIIQKIYDVLAGGGTVVISGFGKFSVKKRNARNGINPKTMEKIKIAAGNTPKFKAGEAFKEAVKLK